MLPTSRGPFSRTSRFSSGRDTHFPNYLYGDEEIFRLSMHETGIWVLKRRKVSFPPTVHRRDILQYHFIPCRIYFRIRLPFKLVMGTVLSYSHRIWKVLLILAAVCWRSGIELPKRLGIVSALTCTGIDSYAFLVFRQQFNDRASLLSCYGFGWVSSNGLRFHYRMGKYFRSKCTGLPDHESAGFILWYPYSVSGDHRTTKMMAVDMKEMIHSYKFRW